MKGLQLVSAIGVHFSARSGVQPKSLSPVKGASQVHCLNLGSRFFDRNSVGLHLQDRAQYKAIAFTTFLCLVYSA